jgi:prevent-host-death family protein
LTLKGWRGPHRTFRKKSTQALLAEPGLYIFTNAMLYTTNMDVAISDLRAHLSDWLERARQGAEVIITDRGLPVARLLGLETTPAIERLTAEGVIARPRQSVRPVASGRARPRPRRPVADIISEQRG